MSVFAVTVRRSWPRQPRKILVKPDESIDGELDTCSDILLSTDARGSTLSPGLYDLMINENICMWHGSHRGWSWWANPITEDNLWVSKESCPLLIIERTNTTIGWRRAWAEHGKEKSGHIEIQNLKAWERRENSEWQSGSYDSRPWSYSSFAPDASGACRD